MPRSGGTLAPESTSTVVTVRARRKRTETGPETRFRWALCVLDTTSPLTRAYPAVIRTITRATTVSENNAGTNQEGNR